MGDDLKIVKDVTFIQKFSTRDFEDQRGIEITIKANPETFSEAVQRLQEALERVRAAFLEPLQGTIQASHDYAQRLKELEAIWDEEYPYAKGAYKARNFERYTRRYARGPKRKCKGSRK